MFFVLNILHDNTFQKTATKSSVFRVFKSNINDKACFRLLSVTGSACSFWPTTTQILAVGDRLLPAKLLTHRFLQSWPIIVKPGLSILIQFSEVSELYLRQGGPFSHEAVVQTLYKPKIIL